MGNLAEDEIGGRGPDEPFWREIFGGDIVSNELLIPLEMTSSNFNLAKADVLSAPNDRLFFLKKRLRKSRTRNLPYL